MAEKTVEVVIRAKNEVAAGVRAANAELRKLAPLPIMGAAGAAGGGPALGSIRRGPGAGTPSVAAAWQDVERGAQRGVEQRFAAWRSEVRAAEQADAEAFSQFMRQQQRGQEIFDATRTSAERYKDQIEELSALYRAGAINLDTYSRGVTKLRDDMKASGGPLGSVKKQLLGAEGAVGLGAFVVGAKALEGAFKLVSAGIKLAQGDTEAFKETLFSLPAVGGMLRAEFEMLALITGEAAKEAKRLADEQARAAQNAKWASGQKAFDAASVGSADAAAQMRREAELARTQENERIRMQLQYGYEDAEKAARERRNAMLSGAGGIPMPGVREGMEQAAWRSYFDELSAASERNQAEWLDRVLRPQQEAAVAKINEILGEAAEMQREEYQEWYDEYVAFGERIRELRDERKQELDRERKDGERESRKPTRGGESPYMGIAPVSVSSHYLGLAEQFGSSMQVQAVREQQEIKRLVGLIHSWLLNLPGGQGLAGIPLGVNGV